MIENNYHTYLNSILETEYKGLEYCVAMLQKQFKLTIDQAEEITKEWVVKFYETR